MNPAPLSRAACLAAVAVASFHPVAAAAETRAVVDLSAGSTAASNPYLLDAPDTGAIGANLTVDPAVFFTDERSAVTFRGSFTLEKFSQNYGTDESASLGASGVFKLDERTIFRTDASFRTSESAARRFYTGVNIDDLEPGEFPIDPMIDPTLGNLTGRSSRLGVTASVDRLLGPTSALTMRAGLGLTKADEGRARDYKDASLGFGYSRQVSARTTLLTTIDGGRVDYLGREAGDGFSVTALAGAEHQLRQSLNLSWQLGASFVDTKTASGGRQTSLGWAGNFDLCNSYPRGTLCTSASRTARPTSLGGLTSVESLALSYAHSFGDRSTASFQANYARTRQDDPFGLAQAGRRSELIGASATYRQRLGDRLGAFVTPSFTSITDRFSGRRKNYQVMLGLSYRLGRLQ